MSLWRFAIAGGALTQIAIGLILYSGSFDDERARLGMALFGLAGGTALFSLVLRSIRSAAAGLNGIVFLLCLPQLAIGVLEGFATPAGTPLGVWFYAVVVALASAGLCNAFGISQLHHRNLQTNATSVVADDRSDR